MKRRVRRVFTALAIAMAAWVVVAAVSIVDHGRRDRQRPADCVIVLGAAVVGDQPSPVFEERIRHALELYRGGVAGKILFTGGRPDGGPHAESTVAESFARAAGIPAADLAVETESRTTRQNLVEAKRLMAVNGWRDAVIVSDPLHLKRAARMAADLGIEAVTSPTPTSRYRSTGAKAKFLAREVFLYSGYWITGK